MNRYVFKEETENLKEYVSVKLENSTLSPEEKQWKDKMSGSLGKILPILVLISISVGTYSLIRFMVGDNKVK